MCFKFKEGDPSACRFGSRCRFVHDSSSSQPAKRKRPEAKGSFNKTRRAEDKYCKLHQVSTHDTSKCNIVQRDPKLVKLFAEDTNANINYVGHIKDAQFEGKSFVYAVRAQVSPFVMAMSKGNSDVPKIDKWMVDGGSTTSAVYDRNKYINIRSN